MQSLVALDGMISDSQICTKDVTVFDVHIMDLQLGHPFVPEQRFNTDGGCDLQGLGIGCFDTHGWIHVDEEGKLRWQKNDELITTSVERYRDSMSGIVAKEDLEGPVRASELWTRSVHGARLLR